MKKRLLSVLMTIGVAGLLVVPYVSHAATATEKIDQQLSQLKKQKADAERNAAAAQNQIDKVHDEKEQTTQDMNVIMDQLEEAGKKLSDLNEQSIPSAPNWSKTARSWTLRRSAWKAATRC